MSSRERVPPGQHLTAVFPVLHLGEVPLFDPSTWDFRVWGQVGRPLRLSWQEFIALPMTAVRADFHCVTGWTRLDCAWEGVAFRTIAELAQAKPEGQYALVHCDGGYTTNLPLGDLLRDDVLFVLRFEGAPLAPIHGGPLRLVVPHKYAYKSAKWVRGLEFLDKEVLGYWEVRGYSNTADPWTEDRFA